MDVKRGITEASTAFSEFVVTVLNESSLGLYRIQEHVHRKHDILAIDSDVTRSQEDVKEARDIISSLRNLTAFEQCSDYIKRVATVRDLAGAGLLKPAGGRKGYPRK
ncbi:hypothetical protein HDU85_000102 [Gaertneriomyces sp. JEL0708]|nr:hypothetical protein HDU85_000102 [Gaertneriomyces sp. JEL0708]